MKKSGFKSLLKKIRPYAVPGIITGLVMIVILILKGIWPSGSSRIEKSDSLRKPDYFRDKSWNRIKECVLRL